MIYVNVTYSMPKVNRDNFIVDIKSQKIMELTRQEPGNQAYEFSIPLDNDEQLYLREIWDEAGFEAHKSSENIKRLGMLKDRYSVTTSIVVSRFES